MVPTGAVSPATAQLATAVVAGPIATSAPTTPPLAPTAIVPAGVIGQRVESAGIAVTVNAVEGALELGQFQRADQGRVFLLASVTLENASRERAPYNPLYFKVKDGEGFEYTASLLAADQSLKSGELAAGERVRGFVAFQVPAAAKRLQISYQPLVLFGGYQVLRVDLGEAPAPPELASAPPAQAPPAPAQSSSLVAPTRPAPSGTPIPNPSPAPPTSIPSVVPAPPKPASTPILAALGQRVESAGIALTVAAVKKVPQLSQFQRAKEGRVFVLADVILENANRDKEPYNPLYFKLKDADGFEYSATFSTGDQSLRSGELAMADKARGFVAFDTPTTARGLQLSYQPLALFGGYEVLRVNLGD